MDREYNPLCSPLFGQELPPMGVARHFARYREISYLSDRSGLSLVQGSLAANGVQVPAFAEDRKGCPKLAKRQNVNWPPMTRIQPLAAHSHRLHYSGYTLQFS